MSCVIFDNGHERWNRQVNRQEGEEDRWQRFRGSENNHDQTMAIGMRDASLNVRETTNANWW